MSAALSRIHAFWCRIPSRPNFGDALTPWLIRRLTGQHPIFVRPEDRRHKYLVVGSIISFAGAACTVWGSGIMNRYDRVSPDAKLLSVRGPLTRARALECGADCPEVYGDPALLLPRLYRPSSHERNGCGIVGHFSDLPRLAAAWRGSERLHLIDIQDAIETVIDRIAACDFVASSSLHGLIASHAYGVPAVWIKFRDLPSGDDSKFHDYFLSLGQVPPAAIRLNYDSVEADELGRHATLPPTAFDTNPLWQACPFRNSL
jgi:pyruvyltransferase